MRLSRLPADGHFLSLTANHILMPKIRRDLGAIKAQVAILQKIEGPVDGRMEIHFFGLETRQAVGGRRCAFPPYLFFRPQLTLLKISV
jgi:hypothetical protein